MRWGGIFDVDAKLIQIEEEELRTQAPGFWDDQKTAEAQMKKIRELKKWVEGYNKVESICDELQLAYDFFKEEAVTEAEVDNAYSESIRYLKNKVFPIFIIPNKVVTSSTFIGKVLFALLYLSIT